MMRTLMQKRNHLTLRRVLVVALLVPVLLPNLFPTALAVVRKKHDAKQEVEGLEERWRRAQLTADVSTMENLLSDDFIGISMTGEVNTKEQQLERTRARTLVISEITLTDVKVKLIGSTAIVTSRAIVEGTNRGASMTGVYRYTRVYQHLLNGDWKITNFEATRVPNNVN